MSDLAFRRAVTDEGGDPNASIQEIRRIHGTQHALEFGRLHSAGLDRIAVRLRCLQIAAGIQPALSPEDTLEHARAFGEWVINQPRSFQAVDALEAAASISPNATTAANLIRLAEQVMAYFDGGDDA